MKVNLSPMKKNPIRYLINNRGKEILDYPYLLEMQHRSYEWFLQLENIQNNIPVENQGLEYLLRNTFPIESSSGNMVLEYVHYYLDEIKYTEALAKEKGKNYSIPVKIKVNLILKDTGEVRTKDIYIGDFPLMTSNGTFIINGAERVVVTQIHRSPGVVFSHSEKDLEYNARLSPDKGSWLEFLLDEKKELMHVKIDKKRKILLSTFMRVLGYDTNEKILEELYNIVECDVSNDIENRYAAEDIVIETDFGPEKILIAAQRISFTDIENLLDNNINKVKIVDLKECGNKIGTEVIMNTIQKEGFEKDPENPLKSEPTIEEAINKVYNVIRPGEPALIDAASEEINNMFFSEKRYDLGKVGRFKLNKKYDYKDDVTTTALIKDDIVKTVIYLDKIYEGENNLDDIDHLSNRRVRAVGELFLNQLKKGFARLEKITKERMVSAIPEETDPADIVSIKPITSIINEFFGTSQLSQFMDQINPLTELTHKRRLSALGPGGLSRERAGYAVRDVHQSHYGRICPIETPEGQNIGLIVSLTTYGKANEYGFLETPYRKVVKGKITGEIEYLTAIEEERYYISQSQEDIDEDGNILNEFVNGRHKGEYVRVEKSLIDYIDVTPRQVFSVSTCLIPFIEHNDSNRSLMGSNMQRQAVPLLTPKAPYVGTGLEYLVARDSGVVKIAKESGEVVNVTNSIISIKPDNANDDEIHHYNLTKFKRTNQDTLNNQRPIVELGQKVKKGDVIADGPSTELGELALGQNLKVAFLSWYGYNYEDAIILSERLVKDDTLTSVHIKEYSIDIRETKLGKERITSDIPNISDKEIKDLDEDGVVRIGARVKAGSILVGKVTPKGHEDLTPEYKLVKSIFGEKASDVKDSSLKVPNGVEGTVIDIKRLRRADGEELDAGVEEIVKVYVAMKRKIHVGDKLSGRHGNKGVISNIAPEEDMPYLPDGTPVDIILNPLGVPSRMNLGQILETALGWVCSEEDIKVAVPAFEAAKLEEIQQLMKEKNLPETSKTDLYDGKTGEKFDAPVLVGTMYILKLSHMVDDKVHARSTGNYSLVTQQPLGGKAQMGGQRLGEMEVWALEAYGASHCLQEFLTQKSDDRDGRNNMYHSIIKGEPIPPPGVPETFNVMVQEFKGLCLDVTIYDENDKIIALSEKDNEIKDFKKGQAY